MAKIIFAEGTIPYRIVFVNELLTPIAFDVRITAA